MRHHRTCLAGLLGGIAITILVSVPASAAEGLTACTGEDAPAYAVAAEALIEQNQKDRAEEIYQAVIFRSPREECAVRGLAALTQLRSAERSTTGRLGDSWDKSFTKFVEPIIAPMLGLVGIVAVASAIAGLTTGWLTRFKAPSRGRKRRIAAELSGFLTICLGALALVAAAAVISARSTGWTAVDEAIRSWPLRVPLFWSLFVPGLVLTVFGITVYSAALGRRLKLTLDVRDDSGGPDLVAAQYLLGRLTALGSEAPKGLRTPENTDVTSLPESAVSILGVTGVTGALISLVRSLRRPSPWRATVGLADASTVVVTLTRNGKAIPNWTTTLHQLGLPSVAADTGDTADAAWSAAAKRYLLTAAAAYVLLEISRVDEVLRRGLCGATDVASLAMRLIAGDESARVSGALTLRLLQRAVAADPRSGLALVALLSRRSVRRDEQAGVAADAQAALARIADEGRGYVAMRLRLTNILAATRFNVLLQLTQADPKAQDAIYDAKIATADAAMALVLQLQSRADEAADLRDEMRVTGGYLVLDINSQLGDQRKLPGWTRAVEQAERWVLRTKSSDNVEIPPPLSAQESYARACYECSRQGHRDWAQRALADLRVAATDARLRVWAREDPSLEPLRREPQAPDDTVAQTFRRIVGDPAITDFFDLAVFASRRVAIRAMGLDGPKDLLDLTAAEVAALGLAGTVAARWERIARLALPADGGSAVPIGVLDVIVTLGVESREELGVRVAGDLAGWHRQVLDASKHLAIRPVLTDWATYAPATVGA